MSGPGGVIALGDGRRYMTLDRFVWDSGDDVYVFAPNVRAARKIARCLNSGIFLRGNLVWHARGGDVVSPYRAPLRRYLEVDGYLYDREEQLWSECGGTEGAHAVAYALNHRMPPAAYPRLAWKTAEAIAADWPDGDFKDPLGSLGGRGSDGVEAREPVASEGDEGVSGRKKMPGVGAPGADRCVERINMSEGNDSSCRYEAVGAIALDRACGECVVIGDSELASAVARCLEEGSALRSALAWTPVAHPALMGRVRGILADDVGALQPTPPVPRYVPVAWCVYDRRENLFATVDEPHDVAQLLNAGLEPGFSPTWERAA